MQFYRGFFSSAFNLARAQSRRAITGEVSASSDIQIKKLKLNDKELAQTITMIRSKKVLKKNDQIIVEGNILIKEAIQAKIQLNKLIFSDTSKISEIKSLLTGPELKSIEFLKVPYADLTFLSVLQTCPGVIGVFKKPLEIEQKPNAYPIEIIADNCREPNNCSIVRVCNAIPAARLLLSKGNVNVWDTKSIRASSGSIFHFPTRSQLTWEEIDKMTDLDNLVLVADNNSDRYHRMLDYDKIPDELLKSRKKITVIIGGETHGISDEAFNFAKKREWRCVRIPIDETVDSLNVSTALAVILFELRRKLSN